MKRVWLLSVVLILLSSFSMAIIDDEIHINSNIKFHGEFESGNTISTSWYKVNMKEGSNDLFLYGSYIFPDKSELPIVCSMRTIRERICDTNIVYYDKRIKICNLNEYYDGAGFFNLMFSFNGKMLFYDRHDCEYVTVTMSKEVDSCHYVYVEKEVCRKVGSFRCPNSNVYLSTNIEYSIDGSNWDVLKYRRQQVNLGEISETKSVWIKFRSTIPEPCYGTYPIEDSINLMVY